MTNIGLGRHLGKANVSTMTVAWAFLLASCMNIWVAVMDFPALFFGWLLKENDSKEMELE